MCAVADNPMIHVFFAGRSFAVSAEDLCVDAFSDDDELRAALAQHLRVPMSRLDGYIINRHRNGDLTVRPMSVFG